MTKETTHKAALLEAADRRTAAAVRAMIEGDTFMARKHFEAADRLLAEAAAA